MKVSIGANIQPGPFGGGNQVAKLLAQHLSERGHEVSFNLRPRDLDLLLLMEPRPNRFSAYSERHIFQYLAWVNPRALVVHRVNECDERKGTRGVNRRLLRANLCADHTVFVSSWLRELFLAQGLPCASTSVILNGSDPAIYHPRGHVPWDHQGPLKLVTHHWGANWRKGFDIYQRLDEMLGEERYRDRLEFTYIGNLPNGFTFQRANYIPALSGPALGDELRRHHVYVTASRNEPGSNHQNEGALCGLPLLYLHNASLPEYCQGFGVAFGEDDFEPRLAELQAGYDQWTQRMAAYPHSAARLVSEWLELVDDLAARRDALLAQRDPRRLRRWVGQTLAAKVKRNG